MGKKVRRRREKRVGRVLNKIGNEIRGRDSKELGRRAETPAAGFVISKKKRG